MKTRQILIAAATSLVVASPAFAVSGSYGEGTMWTDLMADVAFYSAQPSAPAASGGVVLATETGIYERLAADQRMLADHAQGVAGPAGPTMDMGEGRASAFELRTDASIYERIMAAQQGLIDF